MKSKKRDWASSGVIFSIAILTLYGGLSYPIGTLGNMGPGIFPLIIGGSMVVISIIMVVVPISQDKIEKVSTQELRAFFFIFGGFLAFVILGIYCGLVAATFSIVFISALGDKNNSPLSALILSLASVIAILLFAFVLQIQLPLFREM
ncbi:tripartite tricarboxylate transporter TctB family protein [Enterobacter kobei]|uniref:tripartite tricarboxylate transporter TctB family protein n=1 Tax=Enterobacter kobei TaxID=208224 RepID=UPI002A83D0D9|nr:tripartite tricarboxylate transporter TctB family protein [Enterobacter kobei]